MLQSAKDLLTKNTDFYLLSLFSLNRTTLTATSETTKYTKSVSPMSGLEGIGGLAKYCLNLVKARSHSSFHPARLASLRMAKNGFRRFVNREINRPGQPTGRSVVVPLFRSLELEILK